MISINEQFNLEKKLIQLLDVHGYIFLDVPGTTTKKFAVPYTSNSSAYEAVSKDILEVFPELTAKPVVEGTNGKHTVVYVWDTLTLEIVFFPTT
jgi:hypothetical protein